MNISQVNGRGVAIERHRDRRQTTPRPELNHYLVCKYLGRSLRYLKNPAGEDDGRGPDGKTRTVLLGLQRIAKGIVWIRDGKLPEDNIR